MPLFGNKRKRRTSRIDSLIGQHSILHGDLKFTGGLHIEGVIKGNVLADNDGSSMMQLSEHGRIEGEVNVPYIILHGQVRGDVRSSVHIELRAKAQVTGNVYYNLIEMAIGAEVNGKLVHAIQSDESSIESTLADGFEIPEQNT
jgi:cytoskeletal protein CcmA (bactofilin family)